MATPTTEAPTVALLIRYLRTTNAFPDDDSTRRHGAAVLLPSCGKFSMTASEPGKNRPS